MITIPVKLLITISDPSLALRMTLFCGCYWGEGKSGEPNQMAGSVEILTRLAALSLPPLSPENSVIPSAARDLNIL
jgi:hypothetical protein